MKRSKRPSRRTVASRRAAILLTAVLLCAAAEKLPAWELRGHVKPQALVTDIPANSLLQDLTEDPSRDIGIDARVNLGDAADNWSWQADYQFLAQQGDQTELSQQSGFPGFAPKPIPDDERRVFDLTHRSSPRDDRVVAHRIDRLYLGYTTERSVFKIGRQAVSWGNGLIYNPVDFFNPFDPAAIDTEYKTGDDMLYSQYLFDSGDDLQAVWVGRRNDDGKVTNEVSSIAAKYHLFSGTREMDLLAARHYGEDILAVGGSIDIGGAVWRGDLMLTDSGDEGVTSAVLSWSYSLVAWQKNTSAIVEYFHNGFGIDDGNYDPEALAANPGLTARLQRGELFTLAQNYLGAAVTVELSPLWILTTSLFDNLDDNSLLLQLSSRHDLEQDLQLLLALNLPQGDDGSEFGGIDPGIDGRPLAYGASAFAQLGWYF
jgi:hypothetical protein